MNYLGFDDTYSGIRIKYRSSWNVLKQLGNILSNNITVDFYVPGLKDYVAIQKMRTL
jgi:hypothetical protein